MPGSSSGSTIPEYIIDVDRAKAADLGLTQADVMKNVRGRVQLQHPVQQEELLDRPGQQATSTSSVCSTPRRISQSVETLLDIPITGGRTRRRRSRSATSSRCGARPCRRRSTHTNIQPTIDLDHGRPRPRPRARLRRRRSGRSTARSSSGSRTASWIPAAPAVKAGRLEGDQGRLSGEYRQDAGHVPRAWAFGLIGASILIYFLMVGLGQVVDRPALRSCWRCPSRLIGVLPMLYFTGTAVNVQSLLGFIFIVGIKVANTVLMTDFAQELRRQGGARRRCRRSASRRRSGSGRSR